MTRQNDPEKTHCSIYEWLIVWVLKQECAPSI
jgi:hypothetical protein